jgi:hypothetical protein
MVAPDPKDPDLSDSQADSNSDSNGSSQRLTAVSGDGPQHSGDRRQLGVRYAERRKVRPRHPHVAFSGSNSLALGQLHV